MHHNVLRNEAFPFLVECISERILRIGQYFAKKYGQEYGGLVFLL